MIDLSSFESLAPSAIKHFWCSRREAFDSQKRRGIADQGNRAGVTTGRNMDGFIRMVRNIIIDNGIQDAEVYSGGRVDLTLPGFFRPTKIWDLLVVSRNQLIAAVEFKSQVGPSFGNNFNNRVEEALGNALDLLTAFREETLGDSVKPFLGYLFVLEDCPKSTTPVKFLSPHFSALPEFEDASYAKRYEILCRKLVHEQLYDSAALILTSRKDEETGNYRTLSSSTSCKRFASMLAGKVASIVASR